MIDRVNHDRLKYEMKIISSKIKLVKSSRKNGSWVKLIENVKKFRCLGALINSDGKEQKENQVQNWTRKIRE